MQLLVLMTLLLVLLVVGNTHNYSLPIYGSMMRLNGGQCSYFMLAYVAVTGRKQTLAGGHRKSGVISIKHSRDNYD